MKFGSSETNQYMLRINDEAGQNHWKTIIVLYSSFVLLRFLLALLLTEPIVIPDELTYKFMAFGFYKWQNFFALSPGMVGAPTNIGYIFYQFIISPIFIFDGYFFIAGKLLNSLLINATIFPLFGILKDLVPQKTAAVSAALPLLLPSFGFASLLMAENAFIPLTALFLFTLYKTFSGGSLYYSVLSAVVWSLLVLTKPIALTYFITVIVGGGFLGLFFISSGRDKRLGRNILVSIGIFIFFISLFLVVFLLFSKNNSPRILGFVLAVTKNISKEIIKIIPAEAFDLRQFILLAITHLGGFLIPLLLPFLVTLWAWIDALKTARRKSLVFLTLGLFIFTELLALVLLVSIFYSPAQSFARLHGRFLSMIFFFFIVSFTAFCTQMKWTRARKISLVFMTFLTILALFPGSFYFKSPERFVLPIDYPEMCWLAFLPPVVVVIMIAFFCFVTIRVIMRNDSKLYFVYFIILSLMSNFAVTQTLLRSYQPQRLLTRPARTFVAATISDPDSKVAVFDRKELYGNLTVFWLPYNYTKAKFNFEEKFLSRKDIPVETDFVILYGEFSLDFTPVSDIREGKCTILFLHEKEAARRPGKLK
jgi:hypothetical protein